MEGGKWTGPPPSCAPILCPNPPAVVNGLVELLNGTTLWQVSNVPWKIFMVNKKRDNYTTGWDRSLDYKREASINHHLDSDSIHY